MTLVCPKCGFRRFSVTVPVQFEFDGNQLTEMCSEEPVVDRKDHIICAECGWQGEVRELVERPSVLALDVDGTLLQYTGGSELNPAVSGMIKELRKLKKEGWKIAIWTVREPSDDLINHLKKLKVPYDYINENPHGPASKSRKIYADVYLDDKAMSFDGNTNGLAKKIMSFRAWHKDSSSSSSGENGNEKEEATFFDFDIHHVCTADDCCTQEERREREKKRREMRSKTS